MAEDGSVSRLGHRLRRELGSLESYAVLLGILIGAGIFRVTSEAWVLTGPSVILGYAVLAIPLLATAAAYAVYLSTPLGHAPGGEYSHIAATFGDRRLAFIGAWLKIISYLGALAYLANAFADYVLQLAGGALGHPGEGRWLAAVALCVVYSIHVVGIRWFGRIQVMMFGTLAISLVILIVPGLFAIETENLTPFLSHGADGFLSALPPLFFAYAGFESIAHAAGEVRESTKRLPLVFLRGILATTVIFVLMSLVTFGVLPDRVLAGSTTPMADVAAVYLPSGAAAVVSLGAIMALATSLNATMLVPSRLGLVLAEDGVAPRWLGLISARRNTPTPGLTVTLLVSLALLYSGQLQLALNIAVFALVLLYFIHSAALLLLPRMNPALAQSAGVQLSPRVRESAACLSMATLGVLIAVQVTEDLAHIATTSFLQRLTGHSLTSVELTLLWTTVGLLLYRRTNDGQKSPGHQRHQP